MTYLHLEKYCRHFRCRVAAGADLARVIVFLHGAERKKAEAGLKDLLFSNVEVKCRLDQEHL